MSALSLLSGVKRKSGLRAVRSVVDPTRTSRPHLHRLLFLWATQSYDNDLILLALRPLPLGTNLGAGIQ